MDTESEISAIVNEIRDRVRARYPQGEAKGLGVALPDLMPILHARDAAEAKVAAIGTVNPRPAGAINNLIQFVKRNLARALGWFVRDQIEFNRAMVTAVEACLESLNEANRAFASIGGQLEVAAELRDMRSHWVEWREEWQRKLVNNEIHYLRGLSELQASIDGRVVAMDNNYRESVRQQHTEFTAELKHGLDDIQKQLWADLQKIRLEYERLIHNELRVIRQKAFASVPAVSPVQHTAAAQPLALDYARFEARFRGSEEYVRNRQQFYLPYFAGRSAVLDIGCGRGEFLQLMRESGVPARGVDLDEESVAVCRSKTLQAETADVFEFLDREPDASFDGIFASQVIEHLSPEQVPQLVKLCASKLKQGGLLTLETPNPECLAIFATHFYLDPTHTRPIPSGLLVFYYEEFGLGGMEVHRLSPAVESMPSLSELPAGFRDAFFGGLDYCAIGRKL